MLLGQYLDYQRETMLSKVQGLTRAQFVTAHSPSDLTLSGLLYHLALVEEDWTEVRFAGLAERQPWATVDWEADPNWEFRTAVGLDPEQLLSRYRKPASEAEPSSQTRPAWISCQSRSCGMGGIFRSAGCCYTSLRKRPGTSATRTYSAKRSTARLASRRTVEASSIGDRATPLVCWR